MNMRTVEALLQRRFVNGAVLFLFLVGWLAAGSADGQDRGRSPLADAQLVEDLVLANRILANEEIVDGLGHVSARNGENPDRFLLSRGMAPAVVTADDIMEFDLDGNPVDQQDRRMYGERFIHAAIYKVRPDVMAVLHCHTPSVLPFANSDVPMRPLYQMSSFLNAGAPVFDTRRIEGARDTLVRNLEMGQVLAQTLGDGAVVLMWAHGAAIVGGSLPEVVSNSIYLDVNAKMQVQASALGRPVTYLTPEQAPRSNPYSRVWDHLKLRLPSR